MFQRRIQWGSVGLLVLAMGCGAGKSTDPGYGGIGGENPGPVRPRATAEDVTVAATFARAELYVIFNSLSRRADLRPEVRAKLFGGAESIFSLIDRAKAELPPDSPCYRDTGEPSDGSVIASDGGVPSLCLSVARLAGTFAQDETRAQVISLAAREFSHFVGADDGEADYVRSLVAESVGQNDFRQMRRSLSEATTDISEIFTRLSKVASKVESDESAENAVIVRLLTPVFADMQRLEAKVVAQTGFCSLTSFEIYNFARVREQAKRDLFEDYPPRSEAVERLKRLVDEVTPFLSAISAASTRFARAERSL